MTTGTITTVKAEKGFGFIRTENGDVFFHRNALPPNTMLTDSLVGQLVLFTAMETDKGWRASDINFVRDSAPSYGRPRC